MLPLSDVVFSTLAASALACALLKPAPTRSPKILQMLSRMSKWQSKESLYHGLNFKPNATDVYVVTSPKCGTTWIQQIMHQLRSKGEDESFDEISAVIPYDECCLDLGMNLNDKQPYEPPRCFKSHFFYEACPKGAKYILCHRNPQEVGPSFYYFFNGWFFDENSIDIDTFVEQFWLVRGAPASFEAVASYWHFLLSWWPHRNDANVLWLFYEDLVDDLPACVTRIADFMGVALTPQLLDIVVKRSSLEYMQQHTHQFDEHPAKIMLNERMGMPKDAGMKCSKIKNAHATRPVVSERTKQAIDAKASFTIPSPIITPDSLTKQTTNQTIINNKWIELVWAATGHLTYNDMRKAESFLRVKQ